jgi:hypothetical protein
LSEWRVIPRDLNLSSQGLIAQRYPGSLEMLFAYIGPETMMPVASVIAAAAGVFMMFGRTVVGFGRGLVRRVLPGPARRPVAKPSPENAEKPDSPSPSSV